MPSPVTQEFRHCSRFYGGFHSMYTALLIFSFHWAIVLYINSSYLKQFASEHIIHGLFILSAILTIIGFFSATHVLTRIGNYRLILLLTSIEFCVLLGMAYTTTPFVALMLFVLHQIIVPYILFSIDIIMEELIGKKESETGGKRALFLTIMSLTGAVASLLMGHLIGSETPNFALAYIVSALCLIPFLGIIIVKFHNFCDPYYPPFHIFAGIREFWNYHDIRNVFFAHLLLQVFFAWMVIYTPLYLASVIGFHWEEIGTILFVGLMAYVLLEYLVGYIADHFIGEKEMMAFGFAIIGVATSWFVFLDESSITVWMLAMFLTRVGASLVETTTESYFFKHMQAKDTNAIGIFRITRPLSYIVGALLGAITLHFLPFELLFVILGFLMIPGMFFAMALHDTK
jgi:MFS family permease